LWSSNGRRLQTEADESEADEAQEAAEAPSSGEDFESSELEEQGAELYAIHLESWFALTGPTTIYNEEQVVSIVQAKGTGLYANTAYSLYVTF
jgi:hypothetical protein